MKLVNLKLNNFKGIKDFVLVANGADVSIFGDNATGKTTLADAFMWLLFDKDSQNRKDFEIKTLGPDGEPMHGLEHVVEATLQLPGKHLTLRKVYAEKWTKKRGSAQSEFTGHTTDYFVNGVPVKKKEYDETIAGIADEDAFRLLTDPTFFNEQLHWQKRRELLLKVCGDVSDQDVIAANKELKPLADVLKSRTIDDHKKVLAGRRTEINRELEKIPVRIDEVNLSLPDTEGLDKFKLTAQAEGLKRDIEAKRQEIVKIESGGEALEKYNEISVIGGELIALKYELQGKLFEELESKRKELQALQANKYELQAEADAKGRKLETDRALAVQLEADIKSLRSKWNEVNAKEFVFEQDDTCPTCGQALPADELENAREIALAAFNSNKACRLEAITADGKASKQRLDELKEGIGILEAAVAEVLGEIENVSKKADEVVLLIENMAKDAEAYKEAPAYIAKLRRKETLKEEVAQLQQDTSQAVETVEADIAGLRAELIECQSLLNRFESKEKSEARIEELKERERELAEEYQQLEQQLFLTEEFVRSKVTMLEGKINSKFKMARFKLFNTLINGGIEDCCETVFDGVPYANLNNGARLNMGLDIINVLSEHYGFAPPVWIDNAESVTNILPTVGQQIRLVVSEADKKLRIERAGSEYAREENIN